MKVVPILMTPAQLRDQIATQGYMLPLRIEIPLDDDQQTRSLDSWETRHYIERPLIELDYALDRHRDEMARCTFYTATQRHPIEHLLRATRQRFTMRGRRCDADFYLSLGLHPDELEIARQHIFHHVVRERDARHQIHISADDFPLSWRQPNYEWRRADARPPHTFSVGEWANSTLGQPWDGNSSHVQQRLRAQAEDRLRIAEHIESIRHASNLAGINLHEAGTAIGRLASSITRRPNSSYTRDIMERIEREMTARMGISPAMLQALQENTGNGGQTHHTSATPPPVAPPPPPKPPALLLQPKGRFLTLPTA